ncbi:MAG: 4Fe-4S dicluster domain-containing protein [Bacillota bacterium]
MAISINPARCPQNHRCPMINACPVKAITQDGYKLPKIDNEKCIDCGRCIKLCPMRAVQREA